MLVAAAQEHAHATETVQSLRFGERCASVETRARVGANALVRWCKFKPASGKHRIRRPSLWVSDSMPVCDTL